MLTVMLSEDTVSIGDYTALYYFMIVGNTVRFIVTYYLLFKLDSFSSLFVLCTVPLYYVLAQFSFKHIEYASAKERTSSDTVLHGFLNSASNLKTIKATSLEAVMSERFNAELNRQFLAQRQLLRWNSVLFFIRNFLYSFLPIMVVGLCVYRILKGSITVGSLFAITGFISALYLPVGELLYFISMRHNLQPVLERTKDYLNAASLSIEDTDKRIIAAGESTGIAVEQICYAYQQQPVFDRISFNITGSGLYIVEGANGRGKTTLFNILSGLYADYTGAVSITVPDFDLKPIAYMIQENQLFEKASYRENVTLFDSVDAALDIPDSARYFFNQIIEPESDFSGGEKRLCIFLRTISQKAHIYLFDEPLENLDTAMQEYVINTIRKLSQTKPVLVISHGNDFDQVQGCDIKRIIL